jgi:hypothetical protein
MHHIRLQKALAALEMALFHIPRNTGFCVATATAVVAAHVVLCWPSAVARGYPALDPWYKVACYLASFGLVLPPLFDDGRNRPRLRNIRILIVAVGFAFIWAVVEANKGMIPSIGHLAGVLGILECETDKVVFGTCLLSVVLFPVFFCVDRVAADCWGWVRRLDDDGTAKRPSYHNDLE